MYGGASIMSKRMSSSNVHRNREGGLDEDICVCVCACVGVCSVWRTRPFVSIIHSHLGLGGEQQTCECVRAFVLCPFEPKWLVNYTNDITCGVGKIYTAELRHRVVNLCVDMWQSCVIDYSHMTQISREMWTNPRRFRHKVCLWLSGLHQSPHSNEPQATLT